MFQCSLLKGSRREPVRALGVFNLGTQGLVKKNIPYEAQIIRVADEYDALVNKRQYKSHIGITEALKIIIENTKPSSNAPKNTGYSKAGKNNKEIVKKLLKVVIDDIEYEISCTIDYVKNLEEDLDRLKKIETYINKKNSSKKQKDIVYYKQYIDLLLLPGESEKDFSNIYYDAKNAYTLRKNILDNLYKEIKSIKKLHV